MASSEHLMEALLRPPVEFFTAVMAFLSALLCFMSPWVLALHPSVGVGVGALFFLLGMKRTKQGLKIMKYHRNLKRLPVYKMSNKEVPVGRKFLFLGKGFRWQPIHTQRLHDCFSADGEKYTQPSKLFQRVREFEKNHQDSPLCKLTSKDSPFNPFRPLPPVEGLPMIHGIEMEEVNVTVPLSSRVGHMLVLGTTRVGKTRLAELFITQDIHRGKTFNEREVVIFFDPKGDADILKRMYVEAKRAGRENEFYVFHLGWTDISARYNAVGRFNKITEVAGRISGQLSGSGNSAAFKEFAWRFVNIISRALVELGKRPSYDQIARYVRSIDTLFLDYAKVFFDKQDPEIWKAIVQASTKIDQKNVSLAMKGRSEMVIAVDQYIREHNVYNAVLDGLCSAVRYDKTYFDKIVASLLPLLEKLTTGKTAELLSPDYSDIDDERPIFDWEEVIRKRAIVYVGLDALSDLTVASAVGNSMFADLVAMAGHIYKFGINEGLPDAGNNPKISINVHCDEFNELIGEEFVPFINKGGGAGIQVTAYTQTISDIKARIGDSAKAGQIVGNFNSMVMLRVKEQATAEVLTKNLHEVQVLEVMALSSTSDSSETGTSQHFGSNTGDRVNTVRKPMLSTADIMNLPKGQAFALIEGSQLWKIRMPLPVEDPNDKMPDNLEELASRMREKYISTEDWWVQSDDYRIHPEAKDAFDKIAS